VSEGLKFAIIICTYQRPDDLKKCLDSIGTQTYKKFRVIVVDGSEDARTEQLVREYASMPENELTYLRSIKGLTRQRNAGIRCIETSDDIAAFLDDDVELASTYLAAIAQAYAGDSGHRIAGICGNAMNEKKRGAVDRVIRNLFLITDNASGRMLRSGDAGHIFEPKEDSVVSVLSGCNMTYRTAVFGEHGLQFDEALPGYSYMEDQDFSMRAGRVGTLMQLKDARLIHHVSPAARIKYKAIFEMYLVNSHYLFEKNLRPAPHQYVYYYWRIAGKLLHACVSALTLRTLGPLEGWFSGMGKILHAGGKGKEYAGRAHAKN
jgi:GT2 family glycosyltransferase